MVQLGLHWPGYHEMGKRGTLILHACLFESAATSETECISFISGLCETNFYAMLKQTLSELAIRSLQLLQKRLSVYLLSVFVRLKS